MVIFTTSIGYITKEVDRLFNHDFQLFEGLSEISAVLNGGGRRMTVSIVEIEEELSSRVSGI